MKASLRKFPKPAALNSLAEETEILVEHIRQQASPHRTLNILEAGCGNSWDLDLTGVPYLLTGVDVDADGLELRKTERRDLDQAIVGDLRTVVLDENRYDVIYNSFVLEHIEDARRVLDNFLRWVKPGGLIILRLPDRHSVYGFLTRITPFWVHVVYKRYVEGNPNAGKPGFGPFPTVHEEIVSREGIRDWCAAHGLTIKAEYGSNDFLNAIGPFALPARALLRVMDLLSLGRLTADYTNLTYVIEKPAPAEALQEAIACEADG